MNFHHPVARARLGAGLALAAALWLAAPAGAARVVDVRVGTHPTFTRVVFELDEAAGYRLTRSGASEAPAIVVTLDAAAQPERLRSGGDIDTVRVEGGARATARIALRKPGLRLQEMILANPPRIVLDVMREEPAPQAAKTPPPAPKAKPEPEPAPKAKPKPEPAPKAAEAPQPTPKPTPKPAPRAEAKPPEPTAPTTATPAPKPAPEPEPARAAAEPPTRPEPRRIAPPERSQSPAPEPAAKAETKPEPAAKPSEPSAPTAATPAERVEDPVIPPVPVQPAPPQTARAEPPEPSPAMPPPKRPEPARPAPAKPAAPPETESAGGPGLVERVTAQPLLLGAAAGVLVLVVVIALLVVRRRRAIPNDVDISAIVEESESEGRMPAEGFAMDAAPVAEAPAGRGADETLSSLFDDAPAPRPAAGAAPSDEFGFTETAAPATGAAAGSLFDDDASQGDDAMSQNMDLPADRSGGPPPPPAAGGADGDVARLLQDLERRVTALESKLDDANEAREKLERQVAAQSEELRVQRAAIARTQRALRTMSRADEDKATEPALRDDGETKTRVNV